jgi:hypothetical protein
LHAERGARWGRKQRSLRSLREEETFVGSDSFEVFALGDQIAGMSMSKGIKGEDIESGGSDCG